MSDLNIVDIHQAVAERLGEADCVRWGAKTWSWNEVAMRRRRLGDYLRLRGLGTVSSPGERWETGRQHVGLLLYNGNEYLESVLGVLGARAVPFNVSWRYVAGEMRHLLLDAGAVGLIYHAAFAPIVAELRGELPRLSLLIQVGDGSSSPLLPGAVDYERIVAAGPVRAEPRRSGDDPYLIYTGGTTGLPKGVIWRQDDLFQAALGGQPRGDGASSVDAIADRALAGSPSVGLAPAPFMHGSAQWAALATMLAGGTVAIQEQTRSFDPNDVWATVQRHGVTTLSLVGDAFGRPLLDALRARPTPTSLRTIFSGGAALTDRTKRGFLEILPDLRIIDLLGSSEAGTQAVSGASTEVPTTAFRAGERSTIVLSDDRSRVLAPGSDEVGWLASSGRVPLGYLGNAASTLATFPEIDGTRFSVPGDRVRILADGTIEFHGRDSSVINSGGEKVYAEEVEEAIRELADVVDATVVGRPSDAWGSEVVAIVEFVDPASPIGVQELRDHLRSVLASHKLPRVVVPVPTVQRLPTGKPDLEWANDVARSVAGASVPTAPRSI